MAALNQQKRDIDSNWVDSSSSGSPSSFSSAVNAPSISTPESESKSNHNGKGRRRSSRIFRLFNTPRSLSPLPSPPPITISHSLPTLGEHEDALQLNVHTQQTQLQRRPQPQPQPQRDKRRRSLSSLRSMISGFFSKNNTSMTNSSKLRKPRKGLRRQKPAADEQTKQSKSSSMFSLRRHKHRRASSMNAINCNATSSDLQQYKYDSRDRKTMESDMAAIVEENEDHKEYMDNDEDDNEFDISVTAEHERYTEKHLPFARPVLTATSSSVSIRRYDKRPESLTYYAPASLMDVFNSIMDTKALDTHVIDPVSSEATRRPAFAVDNDRDYALNNEPGIDMSVLSSLPEYDDSSDTEFECRHWE